MQRPQFRPLTLASLCCVISANVLACAENEPPSTQDDVTYEESVDARPAQDAASGAAGSVNEADAGHTEDTNPMPPDDAFGDLGDESRGDAEPIPARQGELVGLALSCAEDSGVVIATPETYGNYKAWGFERYTELLAPNGKPIRIFATAEVTDEMIHRARNVLRFFLTDLPDSEYGADKGEVANTMANNGATLMLPGGAHEEGNEPPFDAQPLYEEEMTVEGGDWYLDNDWEHRDATFEEIFHLVHDAGIGTYLPGALPDYQAALHDEALAAIDDGRWGIPVDPFVGEWLEELEAENSLAQEYIASVIDSYYGYWGAFDEAPGGMWGIYIAKTREEIVEKDPKGLALLEAFLPPMADYEARLSSTFTGTFEMTFNPDKPYTHKSRYLTQVTLTGDKAGSILGNDADNTLRGNRADNTLEGGGGEDTVIYCQDREAYTLSVEDEALIIEGPDGRDTLRSIEFVRFGERRYPLTALAP